MPNPLQFIPVLDKVLDIVREWQKNRPINKLRYRLESAIEYIKITEKDGEYASWDEEKLEKYKKHHKKRIFDE